MRIWRSAFISAALVGAALLTHAAQADILPTVGTPTVSPSGTGTYLWTYNTVVTSTQQVNTGDYFRIYDFDGFVSVFSNPADWTATVSATDAPIILPGIGTVTPIDSAAIPNVTFTYNGAATIFGGASSSTPLGSFVLESIYGGPGVIRPFFGRGTDQLTDLSNGNLTNTLGPTATAVPEPSPIAVGVALFGGLGLCILKARRKTA